MDIVVSYDGSTKEYRFYEPTTDTLLISKAIGEGFANLNGFLVTQGKVAGNILQASDIQYHIDSVTFKSMVESNIKLMQRLQNSGQSEFKTSSDKFGASSAASAKRFGSGPTGSFGSSFGASKFGGDKSKFGKSDKKWKT